MWKCKYISREWASHALPCMFVCVHVHVCVWGCVCVCVLPKSWNLVNPPTTNLIPTLFSCLLYFSFFSLKKISQHLWWIWKLSSLYESSCVTTWYVLYALSFFLFLEENVPSPLVDMEVKHFIWNIIRSKVIHKVLLQFVFLPLWNLGRIRYLHLSYHDAISAIRFECIWSLHSSKHEEILFW